MIFFIILSTISFNSKFVFILLFHGFLQAVTDAALLKLKSCFMEAYDDNQDGKIDIREVCIVLFWSSSVFFRYEFECIFQL